jgi:hypothetical protein
VVLNADVELGATEWRIGSAVGRWSADVMGATSPSRGTQGGMCGASGGGFRPASRGDAERAGDADVGGIRSTSERGPSRRTPSKAFVLFINV